MHTLILAIDFNVRKIKKKLHYLWGPNNSFAQTIHNNLVQISMMVAFFAHTIYGYNATGLQNVQINAI